SVISLMVGLAPLEARTISLTTEDADEMASISALAPRLSWVMGPANPVQNTQPTLYWSHSIALLVRFPVKHLIPQGQRIRKAELMLHSTYVAGKPEVHVRRLVTEWGTGVCHQYRMTYPMKVEWSQPGGRGNADRNNKDSAVLKFEKVGDQTADVTEDIELW